MTICTADQENNTSVQVDLGDLAATVALASEALDAAANALAGAAAAVSDAYRLLESLRSDITKLIHATTSTADAPEKLDCSDEEEIDEESPDRTSENADINDQQGLSVPESGQPDDQVTSDPPLPWSPGTQVAAPPFQSALHGTEEEVIGNSQLEDEIDMPLSSVRPHSGAQEMHPIPSSEPGHPISNDGEWNPSSLLEIMKSHLMIPPGRNYIHLDQSSDGLAFIAYMALQAKRIICVVPDYRLGTYSQLLKSLTHAGVHRLDTPEQFKYASQITATFDPSSYNIFLTPYNKFVLNAPLFQLVSPDCILHWGQPSGAYCYIVLPSLSPSVRTCVMVIGEDDFDGKFYGVESYPDIVLDACFSSNSPFQLLCDISAELLPEARHPVQNAHASGSRTNVPQPKETLPTVSSITVDPEQPRDPLPAGHYYIVLDKPYDKDVVSLISYIASNSSKVICHIPKGIGRDLASYQRLINLVTGIKVIVSAGIKNKHVKVATSQLKSARNAVLLRTANPDWYSFLSRSLVDAIIHWGVPKDLPG
ncbi:unnamed protein product [Rhizoctonia solani]|uniref:Uncharacterized protein n=1 Tax=Rhizoctonia solani TaxID=456999 RepID=A0A8H3HHP2_9AGAM|nr:unnamed protein product [Rhizoctonia solani]